MVTPEVRDLAKRARHQRTWVQMKVRIVDVRRVWVSEEGGDGEDTGSEPPSLLSYTLRYVSLSELVTLCRVGLRDPMHLCACVSEEGGDGQGAGSEPPSLLSYTLRYVSLTELGTLSRVGLRDPIHLCACVSEEGGDGQGTDSERWTCVHAWARRMGTGRERGRVGTHQMYYSE